MFLFKNLNRSLGFFILAGFLALGTACGNNNGGGTGTGTGTGGGGSDPSTDAAANTALITDFIAQQATTTGTWTNETFASTGDFSITIAFDDATNEITATIDIDGNVFGVSDPDPETFTIDASNFISGGTQTINLTSDTYGDLELTLTFNNDGTGTFTATADNFSEPGVSNGMANGTFETDGDGNITFTVQSMSFDLAGTGTITVSNAFD